MQLGNPAKTLGSVLLGGCEFDPLSNLNPISLEEQRSFSHTAHTREDKAKNFYGLASALILNYYFLATKFKHTDRFIRIDLIAY